MTTNDADAARPSTDTSGTESPYEIGLASDDARGTDETGPKPVDPEQEDQQADDDA